MKLDTLEVARLVVVLTVTLLAAHSLAALFIRVRQPAVIGEILAGLVLGPTLFGLLAPDAAAAFLPASGPTATVLAAVSELGMLLLMFITGAEVLARPAPSERRTVAMIALTGLAVPFLGGIALTSLLDPRDFSGPSGTTATFVLVLGIAFAVTSIPVISRIMLDLGLLHTTFARIVLSVAALEDIILYILLAVALSLGQASGTTEYGLWGWLGTSSQSWSAAYHLVASLALFAVLLLLGPRLVRVLATTGLRYLDRRSPVGFRLFVLLVSVLACLLLGIDPIFGALLGGFAARRGLAAPTTAPQTVAVPASVTPATAPATAPALATVGAPPAAADQPPTHGPAPRRATSGSGAAPGDADRDEGLETIRRFALAFFIPIYFVVVGLKLDLIRNFDPVFFLWFVVVACALKAASVWVGARLAGVAAVPASDLAVGLNARGGPGIVLATVTYGSGVIDVGLYTSLVLLSMVTSQAAGWWLDLRRAAILRT